MNLTLNLIFNLSLLVAICIISAIVSDRSSRNKFTGQILQGFIFGLAAVIGILYPVILTPGVIFDGRSVVISLCSLFFGPLTGIIAAVMAIIARIYIGGGGVLMGILVSCSSFAIGLFCHYQIKGDLNRISYLRLYLFGILVHLAMIALMTTLPQETVVNAFKTFSLPVLVIYPVATVILGKILKDNFDRLQAHAELIIQKEKAEQSSRLKDAFIASISHEIRTPLNAILGFASIIEDEAGDRFTDEEHFYFQKINQSGERLTRTVDEIVNYSRLMVKDLNLRIVKINLPRLIEELVEESRIHHPKEELGVYFDNSIGKIELDLDGFCIRTSIANLLDNALKYTLSGTITIRLYRDHHGSICISVHDTGIGMSEEFQRKIFEPYSQEDTGYSRRYEGIGLGLSITKKLCGIMKAEISVTSIKGTGSTFTISLPSDVFDEP
ncbi:MAG: ATP-binding protein [Bacteroidales bacterium]|nr:ATP-binding protein [Bacteroidales bacterium]